LSIQSLQGLVVQGDRIIVPTLSGQLLQIASDGTTTVLADLMKAELGIPFGIATSNDDVIVTVSAFEPLHYLVRVKPDGTFTPIANLSEISGSFGAPFGVAAYDEGYAIAGTTDVVSGDGALFQINLEGAILNTIELKPFGNALDVVMRDNNFVTIHEKGHLLNITPTGEVSVLANLMQASLGIPFKLAVSGDDLLVTTNSGKVVNVDPVGVITTIVEIPIAAYNVPAGIALWSDDLVVSTVGGYLLKINCRM
jgi:hypothetical protein